MNISLFRSIASQYKDLRRVNTVAMMYTISQQIESQIIQQKLAVNLYVGFQKFSNFMEQYRRYSRLGAICRRVYVFGVADCQPPVVPGIEFVEISPLSALAREWFVLVNTYDFWTTLVAKELDPHPITGDRQFDGIWSFNEPLVERISLLIAQILEFSYMPVQQRNYEKQNLHISEINSRMLGLLEQAEFTSHRRWVQLRILQSITEANAKQASLLFNTATHTLRTIFGATSVAILLNHANGYYTIAAFEGDVVTNSRKLPLSTGLGGRAIQRGQLIQIKDSSSQSEVDPLLPNAQSIIAAPIVNRRIHGAVVVGNIQSRQWNDEDAQSILAFAKVLALKLEQLLPAKPITKVVPNMAQHLQNVVTEQQKPTARLLALQQKLRVLGGLTPPQQEVLNEMATASETLVQAIKHARHLLPSTKLK
jgi:DICT domain-containing protein/putative methionine-R-sulfoxide reductase with GAF domain